MNFDMATLAGIFTGVTLAALFLTLAFMFRARSAPDDEVEADADSGVFGSATRMFARALPDLLPYKARRDLLRCGYLQPTAYDSYLSLRNALVMGVVLSIGTWLVAVADDDALAIRVLLVGVIAIVLAYALPRLYLNWRGDQAADQLVLALPDSLEMIVLGLSGGLPMHEALRRACQELAAVHPILALHLRIVQRQAAAATLEFALDRWSQRVELEEVSGLAALLGQAQQTGVCLAAALRKYADALRLQRLQRLQTRSNRVAVQMLFPTVCCLAPATYIVLLAPPLLDLQRFREQENRRGGLLEQNTNVETKTLTK